MKRCGMLAVLVGASTFLTGLLSPSVSVLVAIALMKVPGVAWATELRAEQRVSRELAKVPHTVISPTPAMGMERRSS